MVKYDGVDAESVETVVHRVKAEVLALHRSNDYDLSQFTFEKTVANTSPTLVALVSQLVSNGELNKSAVTINLFIQQHISNSTNQTTLGLAVKLYHKCGSSELVKLLNEHGIVTFNLGNNVTMEARRVCTAMMQILPSSVIFWKL